MSKFLHRRRQKDASHNEVVTAFRAIGCSVLVIEEAEAGAPDLIVGYLGKDHGVEVKPDSDLARHQLRPEQLAFHARWRGSKVQVVRSSTQAIELAALWRREQETEFRAARALARQAS